MVTAMSMGLCAATILPSWVRFAIDSSSPTPYSYTSNWLLLVPSRIGPKSLFALVRPLALGGPNVARGRTWDRPGVIPEERW